MFGPVRWSYYGNRYWQDIRRRNSEVHKGTSLSYVRPKQYMARYRVETDTGCFGELVY